MSKVGSFALALWRSWRCAAILTECKYLGLVTQRLERHWVRNRERQEAEVEGTLRKLEVDPDVLCTARQAV
jgi:hypothetical protein